MDTIIFLAAAVLLAIVVLWVVKRRKKANDVWSPTTPDVALSGDADNVSQDIDTIIAKSGYAYDATQDVFYSRRDAWQRKYGYCRLYDEAAAPLGMIIDCEPVTFDYDGRKWMIEFWKGQYDFTTGCEVGMYTALHDVDTSGFCGTFYECVSDADMPHITMTLYKNGQMLFRRSGRHWWQTGFLLGAFSQPSALSMDITLKLKNKGMCDAFVGSLLAMGYTADAVIQNGASVSLGFDTPHAKQPASRTPRVEYLTQWKNKYFCDRYQQITRGYKTMPEKLDAMRVQAPEMFRIMSAIGRQADVFAAFDMISGEVE